MSSSRKADLRLDWCSHEAAKYAVEHWHYSRRMPKSKLVRVGVWEADRFVGVVVFGYGATPEIGKPYGLRQTEVAELVRVALTEHRAPTSRIVAISIRMVRRLCPGLRLLVSFADSAQGHAGTIYQAGGRVFAGDYESKGSVLVVNGRKEHPRTMGLRYGIGGQSIPWLRAHVDPHARRLDAPPKHRYLMPLDDAMRAQVEPLRKPYPKKPSAGSVDSDTSTIQVEEGGVNPTPALHTCAVGNGQ
jgi:hypothetical protein